MGPYFCIFHGIIQSQFLDVAPIPIAVSSAAHRFLVSHVVPYVLRKWEDSFAAMQLQEKCALSLILVATVRLAVPPRRTAVSRTFVAIRAPNVVDTDVAPRATDAATPMLDIAVPIILIAFQIKLAVNMVKNAGTSHQVSLKFLLQVKSR